MKYKLIGGGNVNYNYAINRDVDASQFEAMCCYFKFPYRVPHFEIESQLRRYINAFVDTFRKDFILKKLLYYKIDLFIQAGKRDEYVDFFIIVSKSYDRKFRPFGNSFRINTHFHKQYADSVVQMLKRKLKKNEDPIFFNHPLLIILYCFHQKGLVVFL